MIGYKTRALLYGLPGTGKTSLVQAISQNLQLPLTYIQIETLIEKYKGSGEENLKRILKPLRTDKVHRRLVLLDELDEIRGYQKKDTSVMKAL